MYADRGDLVIVIMEYLLVFDSTRDLVMLIHNDNQPRGKKKQKVYLCDEDKFIRLIFTMQKKKEPIKVQQYIVKIIGAKCS